MDRAGPVGVDGEVQPIQLDAARGALLDVPRPAPFAFARGRSRIEVAGTAPIAVARDEDFSLEAPALRHGNLRLLPLLLRRDAGPVSRSLLRFVNLRRRHLLHEGIAENSVLLLT